MELEKQSAGEQILGMARAELCLYMRFLALPLSALAFTEQPGTMLLGTDGASLLYDPALLADRFRESRAAVNRVYLHVVLHCIYRHLWKPRRADAALWDIACDVAMEAVIDGLRHRCVRQRSSAYRGEVYARLRAACRVPTAEAVYRVLDAARLPDWERVRLAEEFRVDDHRFWPDPQQESSPRAGPSPQEQWRDISERMLTQMETLPNDGGQDTMLEQTRVENRQQYDYRGFLRKFAVLREEAGLDPETFDVGLYAYGMRLYGNLPLIEPLETRETSKVEDFVIAIDTSMSTSGALVKAFLEQTYAILTEEQSFFRRVNIRILQCDNKICADRKITSSGELRDYMEHFEMAGGGGTDFRPVFEHVGALIEQRAFTRLKGLVYFTDGLGTFPQRRPPYDVAFVFLRDIGGASPAENAAVPPWAMKLLIEQDDLETPQNTDGGDMEIPHYDY